MTTVEDFSILLDAFGETVTGTPGGGGSAKTFRAVVNTNFPNQEPHPGRGTRVAVAEIKVSSNDWTPHPDDRFTARGYTWEMDADGWADSELNEDSETVHIGNIERELT